LAGSKAVPNDIESVAILSASVGPTDGFIYGRCSIAGWLRSQYHRHVKFRGRLAVKKRERFLIAPCARWVCQENRMVVQEDSESVDPAFNFSFIDNGILIVGNKIVQGAGMQNMRRCMISPDQLSLSEKSFRNVFDADRNSIPHNLSRGAGKETRMEPLKRVHDKIGLISGGKSCGSCSFYVTG
jgi:hypothetical protein